MTTTLDVHPSGSPLPPGLEVLAVGHGHLRMTIDENDAVDREKARRIIESMLRSGYLIFVETEDGGTERVRAFDADRHVYLIDDSPETRDLPLTGDATRTLAAEAAAEPPQEGLTCGSCGRAYAKRPGPGRQPTRCPDCRASKSVGRPVRGVSAAGSRATAIGRSAGG